MKVAVIGSEVAPTSGGAFTFEEGLRAALAQQTSDQLEFRYYALNSPATGVASNAFLGWISKVWAWGLKKLGLVSQREFNAWRREVESESLRGTKGWDTDNALNRSIVADGCHLAYFITPGMLPVEVPFVVTHWDLGHRRWPIFPEVSLSGWTWGEREWYYTHWLQRASLILTGTPTGKEELKTAYGIQDANIVVNPFPVPEWVKATVAEAPQGTYDDVPFLYYPAQFWPHKNHVLLLEALRIVQARGVKVRLVLTGSDKGNLGFVRDKVHEYQLDDWVRFPGFVTRGELLWFYQHTALMVFPCFLGPDNLPPLEALAAGAPIAVADIPGARDYLPTETTFFDPRDEVSLAALIINRITKPVDKPATDRGLPTTDDYARNAVAGIEKLAAYRRSWGAGYLHR